MSDNVKIGTSTYDKGESVLEELRTYFSEADNPLYKKFVRTHGVRMKPITDEDIKGFEGLLPSGIKGILLDEEIGTTSDLGTLILRTKVPVPGKDVLLRMLKMPEKQYALAVAGSDFGYKTFTSEYLNELLEFADSIMQGEQVIERYEGSVIVIPRKDSLKILHK